MSTAGRTPRLTAAQAEELCRDYEQWQRLHPSVLCVKYGISKSTLRTYIKGRHKIGPKRREGRA
jgi:hypothetical protein